MQPPQKTDTKFNYLGQTKTTAAFSFFPISSVIFTLAYTNAGREDGGVMGEFSLWICLYIYKDFFLSTVALLASLTPISNTEH